MKIGQIATVVIVILGILWIPIMRSIGDVLYEYLQDVQSVLAPGIAAAFLMGITWKRASATGGFWGLVILGVRRAVFSNESGVGNAPMYHGQSQSSMGTDEGLVAMLGPLLDTVLVCSITGLIVIISGAYLFLI